MSSFASVCRVCLAGNLQLNSLKNNQLIHFYETLFDTKFNSEDARPRAFCCFCYKKLLRCHTFVQMAHRSEKIFSQLFQQGLEATHENITELNLRMEQQLSGTNMQFNMINMVNYKNETISVKEDVTTEEEPLVEVEEPISVKEEFTTEEEPLVEFVEPISVKEELLTEEKPLVEVEVPISVKEEVTTEKELFVQVDEPISVKEEVTTEEELLVKAESLSYEDCIKIRLASEDRETDSKELPPYVHVEPVKPDGTKMTFSCNRCNKVYLRKSTLILHKRKTHSKLKQERNYSCNVCNKQFQRKSNLVCHTRTHTGEKPFSCSVCNKQFTVNGHLVVHMRSHTGEKPFTCSVCNKQFTVNGHLVVHMRTHTGEKPFACNVCDKKFNKTGNLARHKKTHTC